MYAVPPPSATNNRMASDIGGTSQRRVYEEWKGSNIFLLSGRLIFGPDALSLLATIFLILAPASVFCVFVARKLLDHYPNHWGIAILVVVPVFTVLDLVFLLVTAGRDPGIIPRNAHPPEPEGYEGQTEGAVGQTPPIRLPRTKNVIVNGLIVKSKYCDTCMLYRPPRCSHCSICNNCVQKFDHHCPWVGQCIGLRNYRFFFMFVFLATVLCLYVHAFCWVYIKSIMTSENKSIWKAMLRTPASIALIVYTFLAFWFVGGLTIFHLYLISKNQSTYENFRYRYEGTENPFDLGIYQNFMEVFFSSIPPSKNNFRAKVQRDLAFPSRLSSSSHLVSDREKYSRITEMAWKPGSNEGFQSLGSSRDVLMRKDDTLDKDGKIGSELTDGRRIVPPQGLEGGNIMHSRRSSLGRDSENNWDLPSDLHSDSGAIGNSIRIILDDDNLKSRPPYDQD